MGRLLLNSRRFFKEDDKTISDIKKFVFSDESSSSSEDVVPPNLTHPIIEPRIITKQKKTDAEKEQSKEDSSKYEEVLPFALDKELVDNLGPDRFIRYKPKGDRKPPDSILSEYTHKKEKYSNKVKGEEPYFTETKDLPLGNKSQFQYIPYDDYTLSAKVARNIEDDSGDIPYLPRDYYSHSSDIEDFNADRIANRHSKEMKKQLE